MGKFDKVLEPWFNDDNKRYLLSITDIYGENTYNNICRSIPEMNELIDEYHLETNIDYENSFIIPINDMVPLKEYINYSKSKGFQFSEC